MQNVISFDTTMPVFMGAKALSSLEIAFDFSVPVSATSVQFDPPARIDRIEPGNRMLVHLLDPLPEGERIMADLLVEDEKGNTLMIVTPFRARNERIPKLVLNEIRTEYSKPKVEFIELVTKTTGNLGGLSVITAYQGLLQPLYEFPPIEVTAGEYIVLHLRTVEETCVDETTEDLSLSGATETNNFSRDLWINGSEERLRKTDGVALVDQDGNLIDATLFSEYTTGEWLKNELSQFCSLLNEKGAWKQKTGNDGPLLPQDAMPSGTTTTTRTICRDEATEDSDSALNWYVTVTSGATPGTSNRTERYSETGKTMKATKKGK